MKEVIQRGQSLIDIALQEYGTIEGLETIFLNNSDVHLHSEGQVLNIAPQTFDDRSNMIVDLFKSSGVEVVGRDEPIPQELQQFSGQFSDQFF